MKVHGYFLSAVCVPLCVIASNDDSVICRSGYKGETRWGLYLFALVTAILCNKQSWNLKGIQGWALISLSVCSWGWADAELGQPEMALYQLFQSFQNQQGILMVAAETLVGRKNPKD